MKAAAGAALLNMGVFLFMGALAVIAMTPEPLIAAALVCAISDVAVYFLPKLQRPAGGVAAGEADRTPRC